MGGETHQQPVDARGHIGRNQRPAAAPSTPGDDADERDFRRARAARPARGPAPNGAQDAEFKTGGRGRKR